MIEAKAKRRVLFGVGASPGVGQGRARRARTFDQAMRATAGDVLLVETLPPGWVPCLGDCRGVVAALGGALSNTAVALRERGIPAVVGVGDALRGVGDGELVEVDGFLGIVRTAS